MINRIFGLDDSGNAFRRTDSAPVKVGGIFKTDPETSQVTFTDGQGRVYWFVDTTAGDVTVTLPDASTLTPDTPQIVKRTTGGLNALTVTTDGGNIDGAASVSMASQYDKYTFVSDGTDYWII